MAQKKYPNPHFVLHVDLEARSKEWTEEYVAFLKAMQPNLLIEVKPPLTAADIESMFDWKQSKKRTRASLFQLPDGEFVSLGRNSCNRRFRLRHAEEFQQKYLTGEMCLNFETWLLGDHASIISCQHRGVGLKLAQIEYESDKDRYRKVWPSGPPTVECLVVYGVSEDAETLASIDNVLAATTADVFFKEGYYAKVGDDDVRDKLTKALAVATEFLWKRAGVAADGSCLEFGTHGVRLAFLKRHPRLVEATQFCYEQNLPAEVQKEGENGPETDDDGAPVMVRKGPPRINIDKAGFTPGKAAAILYLMAASDTHPQDYRKGGFGSEKRINWGPDDANWKLAQKFWVNFADRTNGFEAVHKALMECIRVETGQTNFDWQLSVVWQAWRKFRAGTRLQTNALTPRDDGRVRTKLHPDCVANFGGIDHVPTTRAEREKLRREQAEAQESGDAQMGGNEEEGTPKTGRGKGRSRGEDDGKPTFHKRLTRLKGKYGDAVLLFQDGDNVKAYGPDAKTVATILKISYSGDKATGVNVATFPASELSTNANKIEAQDHRVHVAELSELDDDTAEDEKEEANAEKEEANAEPATA